MHTLRIVWSILSEADRKQFKRTLAQNLCEPLLNFLSLITFIPFLYLVINPNSLNHHKHLVAVQAALGLNDPNRFLIVVGCFALGALIAANAYSVFVAKQSALFSNLIYRSTAVRLFDYSLRQEYSRFLGFDTSASSATLLRSCEAVAEHWVMGSIKLSSNVVNIALISLTTLAVAPVIGLVTITLFGGLYAALYMFARKKMKELGIRSTVVNRDLQRLSSEPFHAIKEVYIFDKAGSFVSQFDKLTAERGHISSELIGTSLVPRYGIEVLAFGSLLLSTIFILSTSGSAHEAIPIVGVFAYACQKLAPVLRSAFSTLAQMRFNISKLQEIRAQLANINTRQDDAPKRPIPFTQRLMLNDVSFQYPGKNKPVFENLNLEIKKGSHLAIVGPSGQGKSTLVNLICGILTPTSGTIKIDEWTLTPSERRAWSKKIGYVGQDVFLFKSTIARNIAFSLYEECDHEKVVAAAKQAKIHDFIMSLEQGYDSPLGDNGINISGGQKQRLAIARALYNNPDILVFDEATSALDSTTETLLFDEISANLRDRTLILITHKMSSATRCDSIFRMGELN